MYGQQQWRIHKTFISQSRGSVNNKTGGICRLELDKPIMIVDKFSIAHTIADLPVWK